MKFLTPIPTTYIGQNDDGEDIWRIERACRWYEKKTGIRIRVPKGYLSDLSSIPRPLQSWIRPFDLSILAPVVHDWLYEHEGKVDGYERLTRKQCDKIFLRIMKREGVPFIRRNLAYWGVRIGGWIKRPHWGV